MKGLESWLEGKLNTDKRPQQKLTTLYFFILFYFLFIFLFVVDFVIH